VQGASVPGAPAPAPEQREPRTRRRASGRVFYFASRDSPSSLSSTQAFQGRHGRAYLFNAVVNVTHGPKEERQLITGLHTVRTSSCAQCGVELGWAYVYAYEPSQQYKVGKVILEKAMIVAENGDGGLSS
jgi:Yippee zinc-binding/DNA-binding /Mis18, centromere assembly